MYGVGDIEAPELRQVSDLYSEWLLITFVDVLTFHKMTYAE